MDHKEVSAEKKKTQTKPVPRGVEKNEEILQRGRGMERKSMEIHLVEGGEDPAWKIPFSIPELS